MLTVKLIRRDATKIVEASSVDIVATGGRKRIDLRRDGEAAGSYFVTSSPDRGGDDYETAFVENAKGATTQVVKP